MAKFKVLKPGETNINSTEIWRYTLHSDHPNMKIGFSGSADLTMISGDFIAQYTIFHNLGYIPIAFGWVERSGKIWSCNQVTGIDDVKDTLNDTVSVFAYCSADISNVYIGVHNQLPVDASAKTDYLFRVHWKIAVDQI
jgi:hypothetical protein